MHAFKSVLLAAVFGAVSCRKHPGVMGSMLGVSRDDPRWGAGCNGVSTPGPENTHPIQTAPPTFVRKVENGSLWTVSQGDQTVDVLHLYGRPYDWGYAHGTLMKEKLSHFYPEVYAYVAEQINAAAANNTFLQWVLDVGINAALDLSFERTKGSLQPYVLEEIQGLSDGSGVPFKHVRNLMWVGELTRGGCSMFGAWGDATSNNMGKLLQLRALDWDIDGPFKNYAAVITYHPADPTDGHAFANLAFVGFTGSVTGFSETELGVSEIGVSYPDASFGNETYLAKGYPFTYLIRDVLQFDETLTAAENRIENAERTCDLILGVGDGKADAPAGDAFRGFQYSPSVANMMTDENQMPLEDWHPRIKDVVYWGMDWLCPNDNRMISHQLQAFHGNMTAENTIRHITSYVQTGDVHAAIYDHADMVMHFSVAAKTGVGGPPQSYARPWVRMDMAALFATKITDQ